MKNVILKPMRKVSAKTKKQLLSEPEICARSSEMDCQGRLTWEHAVMHAGRQIDEPWAILKLCEFHHAVNTFQDGGKLDKEKHVWLALNRATDEELKTISQAIDYLALKERLNLKYK